MEWISSLASELVSGASRAARSASASAAAPRPRTAPAADDLFLQHADHHLDAARDDRLDDDTGQPMAESLPQRAEPAPDLVRAVQIDQQGAGATRAHQAGTSARSATGPPNCAAAATAASSVTTPMLSASGTP